MATTTCPVDCQCHVGGPSTPCSEPGGCGSAGCRRTGSCPVCQARDPEYGLVCEPCRRWLPTAVASIPRLADDARTELIPDLTRGVNMPDPIAIGLPAGPAASVAPDMIVTGGATEPATPLNLHLHDLLADVVRDGGRPIDKTGDNWIQAIDVRPRQVRVDNGTKGFQTVTVMDRLPARDTNGYKVMIPAGDQIGEVPIAQVLDQEMRAWIDAGAPGSDHRPTPTIDNLIRWLTNRLDWACDHYAGIDAFAEAISRIRGQLKAALGEFDPDPEPCEGVECNRCSLRMLFRRQDGTGDVECQNPDCRKVFSAEEYRDWAKHLGAFEKAERDPAEVTELLRAR